MYESWNNTNSFAICIDLVSRAGCWVLQAPKYMFGKPQTNIISIVMPLSMIVQLSFTFNVACSLDTCLLESNSTAISFKALQVVQKHSGEFSSNFKSLQWNSEKFVSTTPLEQSSETCRTTNPESFMLVNSTIAWRKTDVQSMHPQDESTSWKLNHHRATRVEVLWRIPKAIGVHGGLCWRKLARI